MRYKLYVIELSPFDIFHAIYIANTCHVEANSFFIKKKTKGNAKHGVSPNLNI